MITGGCHCGRCRFEIDQQTINDVAHCHCTICRRTSGALLLTWGTVPRAALRWLGAAPRSYASSTAVARLFCGECSAQLAFLNDCSPATVDVVIGALDEPHRFPAQRHIWSDTRVQWLHLDDTLPQWRSE